MTLIEYLLQRCQGVEIAGGVIHVSVAEDGCIVTLGNRFVPKAHEGLQSHP